jgi:hypothetical protein
LSVRDDLDDVPLGLPGVDDYSERMAERQRRRAFQPAADWRDRMKDVEGRVQRLESAPAGFNSLVDRIAKLEQSLTKLDAMLTDLEKRTAKAIKVIGQRLSQPSNGAAQTARK